MTLFRIGRVCRLSAILIGAIAIAVRLIAINQPFVDQWSWRQSDVAAIARNFYTTGFHLAHPQIDWAGDQPGYVGTEFPILPFIAAICYKVFGVHEWVGRSQAVILFALSLPFFFLLVRDTWHGLPAHGPSAECRCHFAGATAATWALFFYSFAPLSVMASRCFMPDMPSLSLSIIGLYFFLRWIDNARSTSLFAAAVLISLSILIKAPSALIGAPLAYLAFHRFGISALRRVELWFFAVVALTPSALWYWHARDIAQRFYPHHFFGAGGIELMNVSWYWQIAQKTAVSNLTPLLLVLGVFGLVVASSSNRGRLFHWWFGAMICFIIIVGYGNRHPWYRLPLVPIVAALAGAACDRIHALRDLRMAWLTRKKAWHWLIQRAAVQIALGVLVTSFGVLAYLSTRDFYRESAADLRAAGLELKRTTRLGSLIVVANYGDPTVFYYAERKGWHFLEKDGLYSGLPGSSAAAVADLEKLKQRGATHVVFYSETFWWLNYEKEFAQHLRSKAMLVKATPEFKIYKLSAVSK